MVSILVGMTKEGEQLSLVEASTLMINDSEMVLPVPTSICLQGILSSSIALITPEV